MWTECTTLRAFVLAFTVDGDAKVFERTVELRLFSQTEMSHMLLDCSSASSPSSSASRPSSVSQV